MKSNLITSLALSTIFCMLLLFVLTPGCKKEDKYEVENTAITGDMTYQQTAFNVLTATPDGIPLTAEITVTGAGTLNIIGPVTNQSTFVFDFALGQGSDFNTTYTDAEGNTISMGGNSQAVMGQEFGIYVTENAISGTGRFKDITTTSGGISGVTMDQVTGTGFGRIEWTMTF
jgi:hypothetical protein